MKSLSDKKSRDELLKESRLLYKKLNAQMKEISKSKEPLLLDAYNRFKDFKKDFKYNDFSKYTDNLVRDMHRDLNYIDSLKSSSLEGAKESAKTFGETKKILESMSKEKQADFWSTYDKAYKELMPTLTEKFKYDIFNVITNEMLLGQTTEDILEKLQESLDRAYEIGETEEEIDELFAENLELLFSEDYDDLF